MIKGAGTLRKGQRKARFDSSERSRLKSRLREFWNKESQYWEPLTLENSLESPLRARAASFLPSGGRLLDIACGSAANSVWLLPRGEYFGTDISLAGLQRAPRGSLALACADAEALPFSDACFDAAISTYSLEHSVNPVAMLAEMRRVVKPGGRIVLLGPAWDLPFWCPNALRTRANSVVWRLQFTVGRFSRQCRALLGGILPFQIIEEPDAFTQPFICDADAVYIVWSFEVIRQMDRWGCRLVHCETDTQLLGTNPIVRFMKRFLMLFPAYRYAGSTCLMVFER